MIPLRRSHLGKACPAGLLPGTDKAFALISVLLVLAVLTIMTTAFMVSMRTERLTSRSYLNIARANLAVESGMSMAVSRLTNAMSSNFYHSIGYINTNGLTNVMVVCGTNNYNRAPTILYLTSVSNITAVPSIAWNNTNSLALNLRKNTSDTNGWIGSPISTNASPVQVYDEQRTPWINLAQDISKPIQPDPSLANYNPIVARFAYRVEDNSSKLDYNMVGNNANSGAFARATNNFGVTNLDLGALPLLSDQPLPSNATGVAINNDIMTFRSLHPIWAPDARLLNRMSTGTAQDVWDKVKFHATPFSESLETAGTGRRRININRLITQGTTPGQIAGDIDDIGFVITGRHVFPGLTAAEQTLFFAETTPSDVTERFIPDFGKRFYTNPVITLAHENIYLKKIGANIRDYIDTDSQPTVVTAGGTVASIAPPTPADLWNTGTEPQAVGKEAIPYIHEHAMRGFEEAMVGGGAVRTYVIHFDHYMEFFNPYTKDYTAPAGTFLMIFDRVTWLAGTFPEVVPPDITMNLSGIVFPAGKTVVITTNPGPDPGGLVSGTVTRIAVPPAARRFSGSTDLIVNTIKGSLKFDGRAGSTGTGSTSDYSTKFIVGTPQGMLDSHAFLGAAASTGAISINWNYQGQDIGNPTHFIFSSSMRGNDHVSRSGDPRSQPEQMTMLGGLAGLGNEQTRFYNNIPSASKPYPGDATLGKAATSFVIPSTWPDANPTFADTAATAYGVIRDDIMASIGELGNIYDPHRKLGESGIIGQARGGGRTLRIGQNDDLVGSRNATGTPTPAGRFYAAAPTTVSWFNGAWRLADIFSAELPALTVSPATQRAKININGVFRDNGVAFRAALRSLRFGPSPESDSKVASGILSDLEITRLTASIKDYLTQNGPMMDRGELSQISYFSQTAATTPYTFAGQPLVATPSPIADRSREEVFRKVVEMITTRSTTFTVYVVGEAVRQLRDGTITTVSQQHSSRTIRLEPLFGTTQALEASAATLDPVTAYKLQYIYAQ